MSFEKVKLPKNSCLLHLSFKKIEYIYDTEICPFEVENTNSIIHSTCWANNNMSSFASSDFDFFSRNFITSAKFPLDYSGFKYPWGKTKLLSDVEPKAGLESFYPEYSNNHQRTLELCPIRISRLVLIRGPCRVVTGGLCRRLVVTGGLCRRLVVTRGLFRRLVVTRGLCRRWNRKTFSF